ncbi:putative Tripeptidyl-peptidase SED2 [Hyaloscypha variabilis]|uniref:tripeptidyl-peptidase II n=1 Tax=Hyaloscypha variabilis (strain UAMH 11265 / GT02V1 / F) TaxID=1149755 RepID=A0A2J6RVC2_HYAVF|nr:putative Tripeptidyl-peptidase SED2 [Hyaloscypha variabilis F]
MLELSFLFSVALATRAAFATPNRARTPYSIKETHAVPSKWTETGRADSSHMLHLQIGLKQGNFKELERHLYEVSSPEHSRYGQHLSPEEVNELVKPTDETLDLVHEWLSASGVSLFDYSPAKDWINIYIDVESAERLLDTKYSVYEHEDGTTLVRAPEWSLPLHLHDLVDTIQPTTTFMRTTAQNTGYTQFQRPLLPSEHKDPIDETLAKVCQFFPVTIECFRTLYGTIDYVPKVPGINKIGFNNFLNETPIRPDAHMFLEKYRPEAAEEAYSFRSIEIAGGPPASYVNLTADQLANSVGQEANLDTQTVLGMTYPAPVYSYSTGGFPPNSPHTNEPYLVYINYILGQSDLPQVISNSYGDDEQTVPKSYAKRVCQSFAQLGARGTTLLVSSGDGGLGDEDPKVCITNDGKNSSTFLPEFPASCPYVTTVGATEQFEPEVAAWRPDGIGPDGKNHPYYASGSGFSYYFERPWYQDGVVDTYVENLKGLHAGLYNTNGRGYPDISAQGLYFALVWNQTFSSTSGTSASTPLAASIISLVNDDLIASGKAPLGFLNPWLYSKGYKGFKDVTGGNTSSCGTTGFPVTKGWDPVTGFGTPIFPKLLELAKY